MKANKNYTTQYVVVKQNFAEHFKNKQLHPTKPIKQNIPENTNVTGARF